MTVQLYVEYPSGHRELHDLDHLTTNADGSVTAVIATPKETAMPATAPATEAAR